MGAETIIGFAIAFAYMILGVLIVKYLITLEKIGCECAMDWRRDYIMYYFIAMIGITLVNTISISMDSFPYTGSSIISTISLIATIIFIVVALQYIHRLKVEKCECSESNYREILYIVALIYALLYTFVLITAIFLIYKFAQILPKLQKNDISMKRIKPSPSK